MMGLVWTPASGYTSIPSTSPNVGTSTASCPAGKTAVGGGFEVHPTSGASDRFQKIHPVAMQASSDGLSWIVKAYGASTGSSYQFRAIAACATLSS
jgi:hypothetical protein